MIYEKNQKSKISWDGLFKGATAVSQNQGALYIVKLHILKIETFLGAIFNNQNVLADLSLGLNYSLKR
jgi:16S rRNA G1207 methylase RsmC